MLDLSAITTFVNLGALAASLWLGFYIITRSPYSHVSWLVTLTLWSLSSFFIHNSLAINMPGSGVLPWLRQTAIIVLPLWFHLTILLLFAQTKRARSRLLARYALYVASAYVIACILIAMGVFTRDLLSVPAAVPVLYTSRQLAGPFYPAFLAYFTTVGLLAISNLWRGRRRARDMTLRRQFSFLLLASAFVGLGVLYLSMGVWLQLALPTLPGDAAMGVGVILLGIAVARYNALMEGRLIERDFVYTLLAVGSLTAFYVVIALILYLGGQISFLTLVLTIVGAIAFNSLYDGVRVALDRLFYHAQFQRLRANLRALAHEAGARQTWRDQLRMILSGVCHTLRVRQGFIALKSENGFVVMVTHNAHPERQVFPLSMLSANEIIGLVRPGKDLEGMALLVPLFGGGTQIGAAILGEKESRQPYSEQDLEFLDDLVEIAGVIHSLRVQEENIQTINAIVADYRERERTLQLQLRQMLAARAEQVEPTPLGVSEDALLQWVEDGLRRLHDFPYLGEHPLAKLRVVEARLGEQRDQMTFIERGKAVNEILLQALHKLRPQGSEPSPHTVPAREWHQFTILYDSYVLGELTRDVMSKLYISESTFNRTRRRALRNVAKALLEMEQKAQMKEESD